MGPASGIILVALLVCCILRQKRRKRKEVERRKELIVDPFNPAYIEEGNASRPAGVSLKTQEVQSIRETRESSSAVTTTSPACPGNHPVHECHSTHAHECHSTPLLDIQQIFEDRRFEEEIRRFISQRMDQPNRSVSHTASSPPSYRPDSRAS